MCLHRDARADANGVGRNARSGRGDERRFRGERSSRMRRRSEDETTGTCHCYCTFYHVHSAPIVRINTSLPESARSRVCARADRRRAPKRRNESVTPRRRGRWRVGVASPATAPVPRRARAGPRDLPRCPPAACPEGRGGRGRRRAGGRVGGGRVAGGRVAGGRVAGGRVVSDAGRREPPQHGRFFAPRQKPGRPVCARRRIENSSKTSSRMRPPRAAANAPRTPSAPSRPPAPSSSAPRMNPRRRRRRDVRSRPPRKSPAAAGTARRQRPGTEPVRRRSRRDSRRGARKRPVGNPRSARRPRRRPRGGRGAEAVHLRQTRVLAPCHRNAIPPARRARRRARRRQRARPRILVICSRLASASASPRRSRRDARLKAKASSARPVFVELGVGVGVGVSFAQQTRGAVRRRFPVRRETPLRFRGGG